MKTNRALLLLAVLCTHPPALAQSPEVADFSIRSHYESWHLPAGETMGMVALGARKRFGEFAHAGVYFYDAVSGRRGGFITLGLSGGLEYPLAERWRVESEVFVGAGSGNGGLELAGGGLMLRAALGAQYVLTPQDNVSLGWSRVSFPEGGAIRSEQLYVAYRRDFKALFREGAPLFGHAGLPVPAGYDPARQQPALILRAVRVPVSARRLDGSPQGDMQQVGVEWRSHVSDRLFVRAETVGAMGGRSAGYMQVLAGAGADYPLGEALALEAALNVGGGGGGGVDSGGGLLLDGMLGVRLALADDWFLRASLGRVHAPDGQYAGTTYALGAGRDFGAGAGRADPAATLQAYPLRVRAVQQTYTGKNADWRTRPEQAVGNLGVQLDYFVHPSLFVTGQGLAAYRGEAGAFMTGLLGAGYRQALTERVFAEAEALLGAAGGGGMNVGSGLVHQFNLGVGYQLSDTWSVLASLGRVQAVNGPFSAAVAGVSLGYHFNLFAR